MGDHPDHRTPTDENATLLQAFEWNVPADGKHWKRLTAVLPSLKSIGITNMWIPPACKGSSSNGNGYDIYDLYDLGEFDQKDGVRTKWGDVKQLKEMCTKANEVGVGVYFDAVLNHKAGADNKEKCRAVEVDPNDRNKEVTEAYEIEAWLGFDFPGRGDKYSSQKYHWYHFTGTDYNSANDKKAIYKILGDGKHWSDSVDKEQGNADYMMYADLDYAHDEVVQDVKDWGVWVVKELGLKGFRLDAVQHYSERFTNEFIANIIEHLGENSVFLVGEFWVGDVHTLTAWLEKMHHKFSLFDAPLLYNFSRASNSERADLRKIFDDSLVAVEPYNAVTCVQNHDTQAGQAVATPVSSFFKPLAYALILLRPNGYPCVFHGDLYGIQAGYSTDAEPPSCSGALPALIKARSLYAYGDCDDYFSDDANCIGWVRRGTWDRGDGGCAVVMSNAGSNQKRMYVGEQWAGSVWTDVLGWARYGDGEAEVTIGEDGFGEFQCGSCSVSVWVRRDAQGRDGFPVVFDTDIYAMA